MASMVWSAEMHDVVVAMAGTIYHVNKYIIPFQLLV
jgi:hypothetical protein